jgi:restriction system protein
MANILWLDDQDWEVAHFCDALRAAGHTVELTDSEDDVLRRLQTGALPDVFIQDLGRSVSYLLADGGKLTTYDGFLEDAGWRFYERFLEARFPQLPVIICSNLASDPSTKNRSERFNLRLLQKKDFSPTALLSAVEDILSASGTLLKVSGDPPLVVLLDFDRVNTALLRHLKDNPKDIHRLSWASFEELADRLLRELGYEVLRTPLTHDGGVDLWALQRSDLGEILYAIDAKKYSPSRLVGPEPVRAIYGVTNMSNASVGMIITTSSFTVGARSLESQYRHRISLKEYHDLVHWLKLVAS